MLPEANAAARIDDLEEIAIQVEDGGDGQLNGNDFVLFYASGPDQWVKDSVNKRFSHQKNLYSNKAFYFILFEPTMGIEPMTSSLPRKCSTAELSRLISLFVA